MKRKRRHEEEDKVLRFAITAVIVLFIAGSGVIALRATNLRVDSTEGEKKLQELAKADVNVVDARIQELEKAEKAADEEKQNRSNNEKFADSLVLGDSITQGLYEYEALDETYVIAERGVGVADKEKNGLDGMLERAAQAQPQKIFLAVGMNDIDGEKGDADAFIKDYQAVIDKLRGLLPGTEIYVNSVLPAHQSLIEREEWYANVPEYNEKLKELCSGEGIVFIDNTELVEEEFYADDGIHMSRSYYVKWTDHMAEAADL